MYGTGMDRYTLGHYYRVARDMNNYVAASAYNYYPRHDGIPMGGFQPSFYPNGGFGNHFAGTLHSIGLPNSVVNIGYRVGQWIDGNL